MEFVDGENLRSILQRRGTLKLDEGINISRQVCAALGEARRQGIVHRDLKPENVMLDGSGTVKVMDFGLAQSLDTASTVTVFEQSTRISSTHALPDKAFNAHKFWIGVAVCIAMIGLAAGLWSLRSAKSAQIDSIAVLPFTNVGGDSSSDYVTDGITEFINDR